MKILKLSNKYFFLIIFFIFSFKLIAEEKPVDIWNVDKNEVELTSENSSSNSLIKINDPISSQTSIYDMQTEKKNNSIKLEDDLNTKDLNIFGLYDPEENGLDINMWINSDGDQLKNLFSKLKRLKLSDDASEIMKISLLTNSYSPRKNILEKEFLKFKSDWLIKNSNLDLIEDYLIKNQIVNIHPKLTKYLVDQYLSLGNIEKACEFFLKNSKPINDEYLTKFDVYCLIINDKKDQAQLVFDLKKEIGFNDK